MFKVITMTGDAILRVVPGVVEADFKKIESAEFTFGADQSFWPEYMSC